MFLLHHVPDQTSLGTYMDHTDVIRRRSRLMIDYLLQVETKTGSHCKAAVMHTWPISRSAYSRIRGQALRPMLTFSPLAADNAGMSNGLKLVLKPADLFVSRRDHIPAICHLNKLWLSRSITDKDMSGAITWQAADDDASSQLHTVSALIEPQERACQIVMEVCLQHHDGRWTGPCQCLWWWCELCCPYLELPELLGFAVFGHDCEHSCTVSRSTHCRPDTQKMASVAAVG